MIYSKLRVLYKNIYINTCIIKYNYIPLHYQNKQTMKELKELADRLETEAKKSTDLGVKAGLMQSVCMAYELINELLLKELQPKSN